MDFIFKKDNIKKGIILSYQKNSILESKQKAILYS